MKKNYLFTVLLFAVSLMTYGQINFPDTNFKAALLAHNPPIDTDGDQEISIAEAEASTIIDIRNIVINSTSGLENFKNLEILVFEAGLTQLNVTNNQELRVLWLLKNQLTNIDLSNNLKLESFRIDRNNVSSIDVSSNTELHTLLLGGNQLTQVNISNNTKLRQFHADNNQLTQIDISNNLLLEDVYVGRNQITQIDVSNHINLKKLNLNSCLLTQIDVSNNVNLKSLSIVRNQLTQIDVSNNGNLERLSIQDNQLSEIDLSNQINLNYFQINRNRISTLDVSSCALNHLDFSGNSNLKTVFMSGQPIEYRIISGEDRLHMYLQGCSKLEFICADQEYLNDIYGLLEESNQTSCLLSSDCDDPHNRIQGNLTFDLDGDGCDSDDTPFNEGLRFTATSLTGNAPVWAYPNEEGQYTLHVSDDTYFFVPVLQNPNYFTINPPVSFPPNPTVIPADLATLTTDYCIQPLGAFNDLEVSIVPISRARPGFNATYLITYKNIGTTTQSGTLTLDYQDNVLNYVSSIPNINSNNNGELSWNFNNLLPMETAEIPLTLLLNTPTDSPALNGGDILNFTATITGQTDETPDNNVVSLAQEVVNSYDPNDKTCLEGDILDPDDVGGYLHYLIRFENEGSAEAVNIRVVDVIDTTKLDIESFVPLKSSHSYTTTITNDNEVEFTFSNINLPFDDANNDGYVLFKIKSKDSLVEGDEIVNSAAIYFDFNFPIITEEEIVTVKREIINEPDFYDYFTLSPNPTTGLLNLGVLNESVSISYILLYDIGGNLVGFFPGTTRTMDVSYLFPNTYFIKIITDKGEFATQFIKL